MMDLDPLTCYLAVVGNTEAPGSVILAASPALKRDFNIKTGSRMYEIPNGMGIHIVNPDLYVIMRSLGHERIETTMIYLEKVFEKERHAIHDWDDTIFGEYI